MAELPLFCQEHLAMARRLTLQVLRNAFENGWAMNTIEVHLNKQLKNLKRQPENKTWKFF